jgi:hypothetical protein
LSIIVHGWEHEQRKETKEPEHGEHKIFVGNHAKTILIKGVALGGKLLLLVSMLIMLLWRFIFMMSRFIVTEESLSVVSSVSLLALLHGLYLAEDGENLL